MILTDSVLTYADLVARLLDKRGIDPEGRTIMQARVAVADAYLELPNLYNWKYYHRRLTFQSKASVPIGITYTHESVFGNRLVSVTSGTYPSWIEDAWSLSETGFIQSKRF